MSVHASLRYCSGSSVANSNSVANRISVIGPAHMNRRHYFSSTYYITRSMFIFYLYFLRGPIVVGETRSNSSAAFGIKTRFSSSIDGETSSDLEVILANHYNGTSIVHAWIDV